MARTALTPVVLTANTSTADPAGTAIDATNSHVFTSSSPLDEYVIRIVNTTASTKVATIKAGDNPPADAAGQGDRTDDCHGGGHGVHQLADRPDRLLDRQEHEFGVRGDQVGGWADGVEGLQPGEGDDEHSSGGCARHGASVTATSHGVNATFPTNSANRSPRTRQRYDGDALRPKGPSWTYASASPIPPARSTWSSVTISTGLR